jgi:hypothetical protein
VRTAPLRRLASHAAALTLLAVLAQAPTPASAAPPPFLTRICDGGHAGGQCFSPFAIATSPATGDVYVLDGNRIDEFTVWGQFVRAWGGGVANGGATGMGTLTPGSTTVSGVMTASKAFVEGMAIEGAGIAPGTTIQSVGEGGTMFLSSPATAAASGEPTALTSPEAPANVPTNELQRLSVTATGGSFELRFRSPEPDISTATTTPIPYNATAAQVQGALEALANIGAGNVAVTSPNPGGGAGVPGGPYTIEFKGSRYADTNVGNLEALSSTPPLSGGGAAVAEVRNGAGAPEVCTGLDCREGVAGNGPGEIASTSPKGMTIDSQGDLYVYESVGCEGCSNLRTSNRVQKFDPEGHFLLMFGGGVDEGPHQPGNLCTAQYIAEGDSCGGGKPGSGNGEFGVGSFFGNDPSGNFIAAGPGDVIYVGGLERVQEFEANGTFKGLLPDPGKVLEGQDVQSLAVDPLSGNLYLTFFRAGEGPSATKEGIRKLSPAGSLLATLAVKEPRALAGDGAANLYVADGQNGLAAEKVELRKFSPSGTEAGDFTFSGPFGRTSFSSPPSLATNSACGIAGADLYVGSVAGPESYVNAYGPPPDPTLCPPPAVPPTISAQYATSVGGHEATLKAKINPHFWPDAHYYVQYGTGKCSEGGCTSEQPQSPGSKLTSQTINDPLEASTFLQGLQPNTTYHYRFVAESGGGGPVQGLSGEEAEGTFTTFPPALPPKADCPNQALRTSFAAKAPDCRAYEMVSPLDKNGGDAGIGKWKGFGHFLSSTDGDRFTFSSTTAFAEPEASPLINQYLSQRGEGGWSTRSINPPRSNPAFYPAGAPSQFMAFSPDLCQAWFMQDTPLQLAEGAPTNAPNLYRRDECAKGPYELLSTVEADVLPDSFETPYYPNALGSSADGTHTVFRANAKLTSNGCVSPGVTTNFQTYETNPEGGPLRLISVLPPQGSSQKASCRNTSLGNFTGEIVDFHQSSVYHAVSPDGSRVFFEATSGNFTGGATGTPGSGPEGLYLRLNATEAPSKVVAGKCTEADKGCTVAISEAKDAFFWGADPEGNRALYSTGKELREFDVQAEESHPIAGEVLGVAGFGEDLSRVYFASEEALSGSQQNSAGLKAHAGQANLYLYERGAGFTFVGPLAADDTVIGFSTNGFGPVSPIAHSPYLRSARVSPDGLHLAFTSTARASGYDNADANFEEPDAEAYLYDASPGEAGQLHCVSCNPSGSRPVGRRVETHWPGAEELPAAAEIPGWPDQFRPSDLLSADGNRLFFQSYDALVPADTNGRRDVYEWERASGQAQCEEDGAQLYVPSAAGCLSLISSGQSAQDSELIDVSQGGRDVFFATNSSLLPGDPGLLDVYDAREGGGFPEAPAPAPSCEGEACQSAPEAPNDPTPGSSSFQGAGNVSEAPARKAKHKKHAKKNKKHAKHKRKANSGR